MPQQRTSKQEEKPTQQKRPSVPHTSIHKCGLSENDQGYSGEKIFPSSQTAYMDVNREWWARDELADRKVKVVEIGNGYDGNPSKDQRPMEKWLAETQRESPWNDISGYASGTGVSGMEEEGRLNFDCTTDDGSWYPQAENCRAP